MSTDYFVREATPADVDGILELLQACMPKSPIPRTREFWEWKHLRNPFGISPGLVAVSGEKLIGLRVFLRWTWFSGEKEIAAVRAVDTVTHPDWQGQGIFAKLTSRLVEQVKSEGVCFVFNTPNRFSLPGYSRMGWKQVSRIPIWARPLNPVRWISHLIRPKKNSPFDESEEGSSVGEVLQQADLSEFLSGISKDDRYHTVRTDRYLKWRYVHIPFFSYQARYRCEKDAFALLIFRKRIRKGLRELSISELLLSDGQNTIQLARELLDELARKSKADYMVATAAAGTNELAALQLSRFLQLRAVGPVLTVLPLNDASSNWNPLDWSSWRCSLGDMEIF